MLRIRVVPLLKLVQGSSTKHLVRQKNTKASTIEEGTSTSGSYANNAVDGRRRSGYIKMAAEPGKLQARAPLVKNFFLGVVDKELLGFPEVISREAMTSLQNEVLPLKNFFGEQLDAAEPKDATTTLNNISSLGLYGINVPEQYNGKGWNWSESLIASEPEANCTEIALRLLAHRTVVDLLKEWGTEEQQQRYLNKLSDGSLYATEALYEYTAPEDDFFNTVARFDSPSRTWTLSGEKAYVVTGPVAASSIPLFMVVAQTRRPELVGDAARGSTIFLIDGNLHGVHLSEKHATFGCRGVEMRRVKFNNVTLPESSVMGMAHEGNQVAHVAQRSSRLRNSMVTLGLARRIMNNMAEHSVFTKQCGVYLKDTEIVQMHLSKAFCSIYAMESMIYFTAGLLDEFERPDVALESAITKYYALNSLSRIAADYCELLGPKCLHAGQLSEELYRNAVQLCRQDETMDSLGLFISASGLQFAGAFMHDTVRKSRNPLFHPGHVFKKVMSNNSIENPKTKMRLNENLHPSLESASLQIEQSVVRLQICTEMLFVRYGDAVLERHNDLKRLSDIASTIYAMFASISRASRSYCIGLQYADYELVTACAICSHGNDFVKTLSSEIFVGKYLNNDHNLQRLSGQICKSKGYYAVHPLTYNF